MRATDGGAHVCLALEWDDAGEMRREVLALCTARLSCVPCVGEIDAETLAYYRREDEIAKALAMGLRVLGASDGSAMQLKRKLRAKGVRAEVASEVIAELAKRNLFCESESAVRAAERNMEKLWGNRRILLDLQAKGYSGEALSAARERIGAEDSVARCRRLLQKRRITVMPEDKREADKIVAALARYGYSGNETRQAFEKDQ